MTIVRSRTSNLNPKETFLLWIEFDTLKKTAGQLAHRGIINPVTKRPYTTMAVYYTAMKYVLENPDEAREYYLKYDADYALDDEIWNEWLIGRALSMYKTKVRILSWLRRMGLDGDKYKHLYKDALGIYD